MPSTATPASPMSFHTIMVMSSAWLTVCGTTLAEVAPGKAAVDDGDSTQH